MGQERFEVIGERLVRRFQTRDPFEIAQGLGIVVYDDCEGFGDLKGMYSVVKKQRSIFINKRLDERTARIVCAHEIGHDQLHRDIAYRSFSYTIWLLGESTKPISLVLPYSCLTRKFSTIYIITGLIQNRLQEQHIRI